MNQQESSLNERILDILNKAEIAELWGTFQNEEEMANAIERLVLQEKIDLLNKFIEQYYRARRIDSETLKSFVKRKITELQNQLKQL